MAESLGYDSHLIDTGLYRPQHAACYLIEDAGEFALIDTGTQHSLPRILDTLAEHGGNQVLVAYWSGGVSKNPYLSFKFDGGKKGDTLKISWTDNQGGSDSAEGQIA